MREGLGNAGGDRDSSAATVIVDVVVDVVARHAVEPRAEIAQGVREARDATQA